MWYKEVYLNGWLLYKNILQVSFNLESTIWLTSNSLQEFVTMIEILTPISIDHSAILLSLSKEKSTITGKGFWKFNSSLIKN